jgi:hypothetical protein
MIGQHFSGQADVPDFVEQPDNDTQNPTVDSASDVENNTPATTTDIQKLLVVGATVPDSGTVAETTPNDAPNSGFARLTPADAEYLRTRWNNIQGKFVDEPGSAVIQADALITEVIEKITQPFVDEHTALKSQWRDGNDVSTEDLRQILQHYRSFFNRLVV